MAVEQQLVDYIKDAKKAGQSDDQTRALLYKNGWTEAEVKEAFGATQAQPTTVQQPKFQQPQQPQTVSQPQQQKPQAQPIQSTQPTQTAQPVQTAQVAQQPQYKPQAQPIQSVSKMRTSSNSMIVPIILAVVLIAFVGFGVYALYGGMYNPTWNPFRPSAESIILKAWSNANSIKSGNTDISLSITGSGLKNQLGDNSIDLNFQSHGQYDNSKSSSAAQASLNASAMQADQQFNFVIAAEYAAIGSNLYIKLNDLRADAFKSVLDALPVKINDLKGKWIKLAITDIEQLPIPQIEGQIAAQQLSDENRQKLEKLVSDIQKVLMNKKVFDIKQLPDPAADENQEYHYSLTLNRTKLNSALPEIYKLISDYDNQTAMVDEETFKTTINSNIDRAGQITMELLVGKEDNLFHKIQINDTIDLSKIDSTTSGSVVVNLAIINSNINNPVEIAEPTDAKTFEELLTPPSPVQTQFNSLNQAAASILEKDKSYATICYGKLLNGYQKDFGKNLITWNKEIVSIAKNKPVCYADAKNYCISVLMPDKTYACTGPNKVLGTKQCTSAATICE